jgi:hypothetical protein
MAHIHLCKRDRVNYTCRIDGLPHRVVLLYPLCAWTAGSAADIGDAVALAADTACAAAGAVVAVVAVVAAVAAVDGTDGPAAPAHDSCGQCHVHVGPAFGYGTLRHLRVTAADAAANTD